MSTAAIVPPPNTSSTTREVPRLTAQAKALLTEMNLHLAGVAALLVVVLYLAIHLFVVWQQLKSNDADAQARQRVQEVAAEINAKPLHGLDTKLEASTKEADTFYATRLPFAYSEIAAELGVLTKKAGVRLGHVQYNGVPVLGLSDRDALTEVRMDATIAGDYRSVMQFINAAERDKHFFVIIGINLTGQQSGQVNLRLRLTTFLRDPNAREATQEFALPEEGAEGASGATIPNAATKPGGPR